MDQSGPRLSKCDVERRQEPYPMSSSFSSEVYICTKDLRTTGLSMINPCFGWLVGGMLALPSEIPIASKVPAVKIPCGPSALTTKLMASLRSLSHPVVEDLPPAHL